MIKQVFITGQTTLHWGRMEFGNIGNYYIIESVFKELVKAFPGTVFVTTLQFSKKFCDKFNIKTVPMELYYDFNSETNLENAIKEYKAIKKDADFTTPYIEQIKDSDFVIDISGDIWGDNADFLGKDRFATGCYKNMTAQLLKPTVMLAGSPGPFNSNKNIELARKAYSGFAYVTNRDPISTRLLKEQGFDLSNTYNFPCPSFIFEKADDSEISDIIAKFDTVDNDMVVGFMLCGWNFKRGPFNAWPRENNEFDNFVYLIKHIIDKFNAKVVLLSHSNGFDVPPNPFVLKHGRDFPIMQQLFDIFQESKYINNITLLDGVYLPATTKAIISHFDLLISGRMHGAVAGLSQNIPTVMIDYGHEPKAHKLKGFAEVICGINDAANIIVNPNDKSDMVSKTDSVIDNLQLWETFLSKRTKLIDQEVRSQFKELAKLVK